MVETPLYEVVERIEEAEIRLYPKLILVTVSGDEVGSPFRVLFDYISGNNSGRSKISMTAPVITPERIEMTAPVLSGESFMSFILPSKYTMDTVPKPNDRRVNIHERPEHKLAVIRFAGWAKHGKRERQKRRLLSILQEKNIDYVGEPILMRYNSPWTPGFLRRNEIAIQITE